MNAFTDILFIFVFVYVITYFGVVQIDSSNVVTQKIYMFIAVSAFASILYVMKAIRKQCPIQTWNVISSGLIIGMLAFIGHTIMFDMYYMTETRGYMEGMNKNYFSLEIMSALFISIAVMGGKSLFYIFNTENCDI